MIYSNTVTSLLIYKHNVLCTNSKAMKSQHVHKYHLLCFVPYLFTSYLCNFFWHITNVQQNQFLFLLARNVATFFFSCWLSTYDTNDSFSLKRKATNCNIGLYGTKDKSWIKSVFFLSQVKHGFNWKSFVLILSKLCPFPRQKSMIHHKRKQSHTNLI